MLVDSDTGKATRVGFRQDEEGKNVRISKSTGKDL
jgi:ribosomal protein L24